MSRLLAEAQAATAALAAAQAEAQACAQAAATAATSVEVVPTIEASIQTFIDPQCLQPTCERYVPPTPTGCPATRELTWDFGEVPTGQHLLTTKAIPAGDLSRFRSAGITRITRISSNLPTGAELNLDLNQGLGILTGNLPTAGANYEVLFGLFDARNCELFRYSVSLRTAAAARVPDLTVLIRVAVEKVCDKEYSHLVTVYWQASGGTSPLFVGPISLVYPNGTTQALVGTFSASGSVGIRANLSGGGSVTVRVQANDSAGRTQTAEQKVDLEPCVQIVIPGPIVRPLGYTLEVYARRQVSVTPGYEELRVPVRITGETEDRVTPFSSMFSAGSQVTLRFPGRVAGGAYGRGPIYYDEWVGDATTPTRKSGTWDARREYYLITVTMSAKVKLVVGYQDIIG